MLGPVFASETHGYDTVDHFRVDPRLGDEDDLVRLIAAAHQRGLRVVLDGVFNHVGRGFAKFGDALRDGPGSEAAGWFRLRWPEGGGPPVADGFEGHDHLVALDHGNPAVADHVVAVLDHWCGRGVDGWRMDAAYAVPTAFWSEVCERLRRRHPQAWLFGEVIHGDYPAFVRDSGLDAVTQYELWKAVGSALNDANFFELAHALERHQGFLDAFVPVTFLGNHDTTRIASLLADIRHLPHALVVLFGVGGTPVVYAGDEQAFRGVKYEREHGDDEVRPPFPARPEELSSLGRDHVPAAPAPHRLPPRAAVAHPRGHRGDDADQHHARLREREPGRGRPDRLRAEPGGRGCGPAAPGRIVGRGRGGRGRGRTAAAPASARLGAADPGLAADVRSVSPSAPTLAAWISPPSCSPALGCPARPG